MTITSEHSIRVREHGEVHILNVYDVHRNLLASVQIRENLGDDKVTVKVECVEKRVVAEVKT